MTKSVRSAAFLLAAALLVGACGPVPTGPRDDPNDEEPNEPGDPIVTQYRAPQAPAPTPLA